MKKHTIVIAAVSLAAALAWAQTKSAKKKEDGPQPVMVDPGGPEKAPSDAVVLFNGADMSSWTMADGKPADWTVQGGNLVCRTGAGDLYSRVKFRAAQIHLEFNVPSMPGQSGQAKGNSGVMLHDRTDEIQILDSLNNPTYADGVCGALYAVAPPLVNAWRRAGEWQTYDIIFHPPHCGTDGAVQAKGSLTVLRNGVLVQDHVPDAPRTGCMEEGSLILQDHNGFGGKPVPAGAKLKAPITPVRFRNIWLRRLAD